MELNVMSYWCDSLDSKIPSVIEVDLKNLKGCILKSYKIYEDVFSSDESILELSVLRPENKFTGGRLTKFHFYHPSDCCSGAYLESAKDLDIFIDQEITDISKRTNEVDTEEVKNNNNEYKNKDEALIRNHNYRNESATWTFYELTCEKGSATLRFVGESNGYYSEEVNLAVEVNRKLEEPKETPEHLKDRE